MKIIFTVLSATCLLAVIPGCANDRSAPSQANRIGGQMGVTTSSRNMSGVTPEHGNPPLSPN